VLLRIRGIRQRSYHRRGSEEASASYSSGDHIVPDHHIRSVLQHIDRSNDDVTLLRPGIAVHRVK